LEIQALDCQRRINNPIKMTERKTAENVGGHDQKTTAAIQA
jgi:hypothetical protein